MTRSVFSILSETVVKLHLRLNIAHPTAKCKVKLQNDNFFELLATSMHICRVSYPKEYNKQHGLQSKKLCNPKAFEKRGEAHARIAEDKCTVFRTHIGEGVLESGIESEEREIK